MHTGSGKRPSGWALFWTLLGIALVIRTGVRDRGVITDHLEFGRRLLEGLDLYAPFLDPGPLHPPYPPSFGLLTAPFSLLPERLARIAWGLLQVGALYCIGRSLRAMLAQLVPALQPRLNLLLLGTALLAGRYILRDTHGGGGNLINLALGLLAFTAAGRGKGRTAGLCLGISLATKPTFILLLPLFWLFGYRKATIWATVTVALAVGVSLLFLRLDPSAWHRWLDGSMAYAAQADPFATPDLGFPPFTWMNQGLRYAAARYLGEVPANLGLPGFPGAGLDTAVTAWIGRGLALFLLLTTAWTALRHRSRLQEPALLAATLTLSLLLSPISWKAHHVALIPAFFLLMIHGAQGRRWVWALAVAYLLSCGIGGDLLGADLQTLQESLYVLTLWDLVLWALCLHLVRVFPERNWRPARGQPPPSSGGNGPGAPAGAGGPEPWPGARPGQGT